MSTEKFMARLKNIRDKYGCSQPKPSPFVSDQDSHLRRENPIPSNRPHSALKSNSYATIAPNKYDNILTDKSQRFDRPLLETKFGRDYKIQEVSERENMNRISFGNSDLRSGPTSSLMMKRPEEAYLRKDELQRQIAKIRQTYAADRKKIVDNYDAHKTHNRLATDFMSKQYEKSSLGFDSKHRNHETFSKEMSSYSQSKNLTNNAQYDSQYHEVQEQSISPIKRMGNYNHEMGHKSILSSDRLANKTETDHGNIKSDNYWRQREARLSELTSNRLNEQRYTEREDEWHKEYALKKSSSRLGIKNQSSLNRTVESPIKPRYNKGENNENLTIMASKEHTKNSDYSVGNIDRIQQRIQSILGR